MSPQPQFFKPMETRIGVGNQEMPRWRCLTAFITSSLEASAFRMQGQARWRSTFGPMRRSVTRPTRFSQARWRERVGWLTATRRRRSFRQQSPRLRASSIRTRVGCPRALRMSARALACMEFISFAYSHMRISTRRIEVEMGRFALTKNPRAARGRIGGEGEGSRRGYFSPISMIFSAIWTAF